MFRARRSGPRISRWAQDARTLLLVLCPPLQLWCSQLRRTAQARSSAAALRLVPYRAISSHFSPGAAAPNNPVAFAFHTLRCRSRRCETELGMISRASDRMAIIIYPAQIGAKKNHGAVAGLWPTEFRCAIESLFCPDAKWDFKTW